MCVGWSCHTERVCLVISVYVKQCSMTETAVVYCINIAIVKAPALYSTHSATHDFINHFITYHKVLSISSKQDLFLELDVTVYLPSVNPVDKRKWKKTPSQSVHLATAIKWFSVTCGQEFTCVVYLRSICLDLLFDLLLSLRHLPNHHTLCKA